jgi:signal transduction histidine kinase
MNDLFTLLTGRDSGQAAWRDDAAVVVLACAAALFLVAGVVRLARWRLVGDPHSALVGSALVVMGGLYLPLVGIAEVSGALSHRELGEAVVRAFVMFIAVGLVVRAQHATGVSTLERPSRLLPASVLVVGTVFLLVASAEAAMSAPLPGGPEAARVLSASMTLTWGLIAVVVLRQTPIRPWSRRAAPLFAALAVAEAAYGQAPGTTYGVTAALCVCASVAAATVWSANRDLDVALSQTQRTIGSLSRTLHDVRGQAVELSHWRDQLVHDAGNSVAGLRAALDVLDARQAAADPPAANLYRAAAEEVRHLDHLLHRSPDEPASDFDAGAVVRSVGLTARTLGQDVTVDRRTAHAVGRPGDLVVVLKNLLTNAARHAPGAHVDLTVENGDGTVRVVCADDGPGLDEDLGRRVFERGVRGPGSAGTGLGLYEARLLMRAQGGDLVLDGTSPGARFVASLPAARSTAAARRGEDVPRAVVPSQRTGSTPVGPVRQRARAGSARALDHHRGAAR